MEQREAAGGEPAELRSTEQPELFSLIIGGEEEATPEEKDDRLANGHGEDQSEAGIRSPGTSYWSITEGPDHPLLLSPAPGPSGRKSRVQQASRPGLSRIPGRDHRRYYHEYWRSEYLMDFDPQRHGMICMVCGSSLATLKLSTIKRHIKQKHPDSLLWSDADKDVIRSGWESHLSLGGAQSSYSVATAAPSAHEEDESLDSGHHAAESLDPVPLQEQPPASLSPLSEPPPLKAEPDLPGPSARTLERYLNDSLHALFRQEFLMEYEAEAGRLLCMVCGGELPSLHLDHIKSHVLDTHPTSLVYSSEEKHCVLQAWAQSHAEEPQNSVQSESDTKDGAVKLFAQDGSLDLHPGGDAASTQDPGPISADGGQQALHPPRKRRLRGGNPWRLRLDYLVAYGPQGRGTFCMVCSQVLQETKVSSFRQHIHDCHPETTALTRQERQAMAAAWTKECSADATQTHNDMSPSAADVLHTSGDANEDFPPGITTPSKMVKTEDGVSGGKGRGDGAAAPPTRHGHYPGKDQRRNYQVRWRLEYLMDYDCRRHGLICMVCGATLATLKVSTIKRHIQQVHASSLFYSADQKQQVLLSYNQNALRFIHSDDCFFSQDHSELLPSPTHPSA